MDENQIKKKYIKQISQIKKHNKYYFNDNNPKISDLEYDKLKKVYKIKSEAKCALWLGVYRNVDIPSLICHLISAPICISC